MKFTVLKSNFLKALGIVGKGVNPRSAMPILSNVLIKTDKGRLRLTTSDLNVTTSVWVGAKVDTDGGVAVPSRLLADFINQISDEKVSAVLDKETLKLKTDKSSATFNGMKASEFPETEVHEDGLKVSIPSTDLVKAISYVQFAVAADEGRPVLSGIYLRLEGDKLILAGTDGFRMAEYRIKLDKPIKSEEPIAVVLPGKAFGDTVRSFAPESENIEIDINSDKNIAIVKVEDMESQLRMIEGQYPDYESVVPDDFSTEIKFEKQELSTGIKLASVFARELGNMIKVVAGEEDVKVLSQPSETGSNEATVNGELEGEPLEIAFNAKYILDLVNNIGEDELSFKASESLKPGLFKLVGLDNYFYLVMPMKANW